MSNLLQALKRAPPFFAHPFPFFCPVHPALAQAMFFPKIPSFWDLRSTLSSIEKDLQGLGFGDGSGRGCPTEERKILFSGARNKVRSQAYQGCFAATIYTNTSCGNRKDTSAWTVLPSGRQKVILCRKLAGHPAYFNIAFCNVLALTGPSFCNAWW